MNGLADKEALACGAVLAAPDVDKARQVIAALGISPATMTDPLTRAVLTIAIDMLGRNELPSAATVFVEGGTKNLFDAKDRERLRDWQISDTLNDTELVTIGRTLARESRNRRVGDMLVALGTAIKAGRSKQGLPFGYVEGRAWFEQLARDYEQSYAQGIKGPEAVAMTRARAEARWERGEGTYVPSGIPAFDALFAGYPRAVCNVLGHAGRGKSTYLGTQLGLHATMGLKPVIYVSEDDFTAPVERHVSLRMGMKRRDVYAKRFVDDAKAHDVEAQLASEWQGVTFYTKAHANTVDEVLRLFTAHVLEDDAQSFMIDNITGLSHALLGKADTVHDSAARGLHRMQAWCERWGRMLLVASHTNNMYWQRTRARQHPEMPDTAQEGGGANAGRYYRFAVGVYQVAETLRLTCIKNNAEGALEARRATLAFDAHVDQGLIDVDSGREVNLAEEARQRKEAQDAAKLARDDAGAKRVRERNAQWRAADAAKKAAAAAELESKKPAQGVLLEVDTPKERT